MSTSNGPVTTIVGAEVDGRLVDVRIEGQQVTGVGEDLPQVGTTVVHARGGALLPGLHDHHLHLLAMAAADRSLDVGAAADAVAFDQLLRTAAHPGGSGWLRVVGYDERHGALDRQRLDQLAPDRRVRVQHRSGAAWVVSSAGLSAIGRSEGDGWLHRGDAELGRRWADEAPPDLAAVGARLARLGVTGVTDATPSDDPGAWSLLAAARADGHLPQRVAVTGSAALADAEAPVGLERGPVKVVVGDHALPAIDELVAAFRAARRAGRPVAVHCVTRVALVLALAAWDEVGSVAGDRIEHGAVVPVELMAAIAAHSLTVVTQPAFVHVRGDRYLAEVEADDQPHLYRCASLLTAGIGVAGSTDAPFGPADPWAAMRSAVDRRTASGRPIGVAEAIDPRGALRAFLGPLDDPAGPARRVAVDAPADLCLFEGTLAEVLADLSSQRLQRVWVAGRVVWE